MYYLAIDIGASSGRHIIGEKKDGKLSLTEIYRFDNNLCENNGHLCWNVDELFGNIVAGMKKCGECGMIPSSVAIDTWGVDFVIIDENGKAMGDTVAYRDSRTDSMDEKCEAVVPFDEHYARTGIQKQPYNTVYQLLALKQEHPEILENGSRLLMMPEYLSYLLTGSAMNEYTEATTTALVNAAAKTWDYELIRRLGLPEKLFGELNAPMTVVGKLKKDISEEVGYDADVIFAASHDTGSAFMAVPAKDDNAVYISSGTWSLLGVENREAHSDPASMAANFTNEGGFEYRYRYLKNIMGLWIIQSVRRNYDKKYSFAQLEEFARQESGFSGRIDVNSHKFLAPQSMVDAVTENSDIRPQNIGQLMECVYRSLAESYAQSIKELESLTGKKYSSINIVGGGSKDTYLNTLTAQATGIPVFAGPTEGTAIGNLMCQMIKAGEFANLQDARDSIKKSFEIKRF
jgi:rhamnulokinase